MSAEGTKSETPGHGPAPSQAHHDYVAILRQQQANLKFLLRYSPPHHHPDERGIPAENIRLATIRLQESMMWASTGIYGEHELPPPDRATLEAAARLSPFAAAAAEQIMKKQLKPINFGSVTPTPPPSTAEQSGYPQKPENPVPADNGNEKTKSPNYDIAYGIRRGIDFRITQLCEAILSGDRQKANSEIESAVKFLQDKMENVRGIHRHTPHDTTS